MDKSSVDWCGSLPALATPFDARGGIDEAAYRRNVELCLATGARGVVANGCTGESWAQTLDERKRVAEICVDVVAGRVPVIAGTGGIRTEDVIELTRHAKAAGCDGVMVWAPFFVKPCEADLIAHFEAVSDAVEIPILLYNIPKYNNNVLTPALVDRLADVENVVGIKESSGDFNNFYETLKLAGDRIGIFLGPVYRYGPAALMHGARGYVTTLGNLWGEPMSEVYDAVEDGDMGRAMALQERLRALNDLVTGNGRNLYTGLKACMNLIGLPGGYPRLPLRPLGEPHLSELKVGMERLGVAAPRAAAAE